MFKPDKKKEKKKKSLGYLYYAAFYSPKINAGKMAESLERGVIDMYIVYIFNSDFRFDDTVTTFRPFCFWS